MRSLSGLFFILLIMLLLDAYVFQAYKTIIRKSRFRKALLFVYISISILSVVALLTFFYVDPTRLGKPLRSIMLSMVMGIFIAKMIGSIFFLVDDIRRFFIWIGKKAIPAKTMPALKEEGKDNISRSVFLSWMGFVAGGSLFSGLLYGFSNKYNYQIKTIPIKAKQLPAAFKGLKIVHISDIHSGSLNDIAAVERGVKMILDQQPDLILFTGDMVNDRATELLPLKNVFAKLKAPMGVYSVLGNHDYGDYVQWPYKGVSKDENLQHLVQLQEEMGWKVLLNEHVILKKDDAQIALIGVENWSNKSRFPAYGRLKESYAGTESVPFKILLTHDPSHWDAEVVSQFSDIDLTLCGHTHGMQFGVEIPGFKWSPVQYMYKQWAGLYQMNNQHLYINRGFGFIGYPGRLGILPEITLIELL